MEPYGSLVDLARQVEAQRKAYVAASGMPLREGPPAAPPTPAEVARVLGLPIPFLDRMLEVRVPGLPVTLWFVPGENAVELLMAEGVTRGRIWTSQELLTWLTIPGITKASTRTTIEYKLAFEGVLTAVGDGRVAQVRRSTDI
jgi:hypothetical protein